MQVEIPFAGPSDGSTLRIWRSLVQTLKLQPTPQYVHTVLVRRMRDSRMADSTSDMRRMEPYPVCGSAPLATVTQCTRETHWDSPIVEPPSQRTRGCWSSQLMDSVSFTSTFWQASTQRPHRTHWSGS